jgi:predicted metal-binding membrane protein
MNTLAAEWRTSPGTVVSCVLVFIASTWVTILWCGAACDMPGMGAWDRLPHQSRLDHFLAFEGMWIVMMVAMMMPVLAPALMRFRQGLSGPAPAIARHTLLFAGAYFAAWALAGPILYAPGIAVAQVANHPAGSPWIPAAGSTLILLAGCFQFSATKRRQIECCRSVPMSSAASPASARRSLLAGWRIGVRCVACCAGLTVTLLIAGVMDLLAMAAVTVGIVAERLLPRRARMERGVGVILVTLGVFLLAQSLTQA